MKYSDDDLVRLKFFEVQIEVTNHLGGMHAIMNVV